jgi:hypothetical protein
VRFHPSGIVALALVASSCGYALAGRGNALPASMTIIGVPDFVNQSSEPEIERILTDAVRVEFQSKGRYQVQPEQAGAHGVLVATVTSVDLRPTSFTADRLPSSYAIVVTANVEFRNLQDNDVVIWASPAFRASEEYPVTAEASLSDVSAFLTQNPNAKERLATKFARDIVTSIFEAF